jgi:hypothetical protein
MAQQGEIKVIEQREQHYQQQEQSSISNISSESPVQQEEELLVDIINLKTVTEWSEEELSMIENINDSDSDFDAEIDDVSESELEDL